MSEIGLWLLAVAPTMLICLYIFKMDKYEAEPRIHLFVCFLLGAVCTLPALNMEILGKRFINADPHNLLRTFMFATFVIGLSEEILKFFALLFYAFPRRQFNEPMDGIVYSTMIGMGFSALENIFYVQNNPNEAFTIAIARAFTAVPAHGLFALAMGYYVGKAKFAITPNEKLLLSLKGLTAAIILHGMYDFLLIQSLYQVLMMLATLSVVIGWYCSGYLIKEHQNASPFRDDHHDEFTLAELAALDRHRFLQNTEIVEMMLTRMQYNQSLEEGWGEVYNDRETGDQWLKFGVSSAFTEDVNVRLVRLPGPNVNEVINLTFTSAYEDEIEAAATFLTAQEHFENSPFREKLLTRLEEFDLKELGDLHRERFRVLIEQTNLATHFDAKFQEKEICARATKLLSMLS